MGKKGTSFIIVLFSTIILCFIFVQISGFVKKVRADVNKLQIGTSSESSQTFVGTPEFKNGMYVSGGNVGVGTTGTSERVVIDGNLKVNEKIVNTSGEIISIPSGFIGMYNSSCPNGWTRVTALDNKFPRGSETYGSTGGSDDAIVVSHSHSVDPPSHYHSVDPPNTNSGNPSANHYHGVNPPNTNSGYISHNHSHGVNPPNTYSAYAGNHRHSWTLSMNPKVRSGSNQWRTDYTSPQWSGTYYTSYAGNHRHTTDIGNFNSGTVSSNHYHATDIGNFNSGTVSSWHYHATNIGAFNSASYNQTAFNSASTGSSGTGANVPAYFTVVFCSKD